MRNFATIFVLVSKVQRNKSMVIKKSSYVKGAANYGQCLVSDIPQIAVCGKSNVGKSTFINFLVNDGKLARTSKLPGRTRLVNYFLQFFSFDICTLRTYIRKCTEFRQNRGRKGENCGTIPTKADSRI